MNCNDLKSKENRGVEGSLKRLLDEVTKKGISSIFQLFYHQMIITC